MPHTLPLTVQRAGPAQGQRFPLTTPTRPDGNQTRTLWPVRWCRRTLKRMQGSVAPVRWLSLSLLKYECFMSRFTILCLIGRPRHPEPVCAYCYILMQPILLLCFMFISAFFPWNTLCLCVSPSLSSPCLSVPSKDRLRLEFIVR